MKKNREQRGIEFDEATVIPIVREEVKVEKRRRETGVTRIRKIVRETSETIDEPIRSEKVIVDRVPINKIVEKAAPAREEEGILIVPVYEEIAVVEKRLLLKEEIHIRKKTEEGHKTEVISLRSEEAVVEHHDMPEHAEGAAEKSVAQPRARRAV